MAGVLSEEELGKKMFVHALRNEYAARVHNLRAYDAISRQVSPSEGQGRSLL